MRVLLVCSGNICRSPMAAEYLRHRAAAERLSHLVVASAGTLGIEGAPAAPHAVRVLADEGFDLRRHRSRGLTLEDARTTDLVVGMERAHLEGVRRRLPGLHAELVLLRAYERSPHPETSAPDLPDPVGMPLAAFRACFATIRTSVDHLVLSLKHAP